MGVTVWINEGHWAFNIWDANECTIERSRNGFFVLDHSIQHVVAEGRNKKELIEWLNRHK
jgi:hypothetical protein